MHLEATHAAELDTHGFSVIRDAIGGGGGGGGSVGGG